MNQLLRSILVAVIGVVETTVMIVEIVVAVIAVTAGEVTVAVNTTKIQPDQ
jgi:hypothetical protein